MLTERKTDGFFLVQYGVRSYGNSISETILSLMATIALLDQFEWETNSSARV